MSIDIYNIKTKSGKSSDHLPYVIDSYRYITVTYSATTQKLHPHFLTRSP